MVIEARRQEIGYYCKINVYTKVLREEASKTTGKAPIQVRWVDVNKVTHECPDIRSRLVAKEVRTSVRHDLDMIALTPPIKALKVLLSLAAASQHDDICLMHNDVSRAY